jgi:hypothetical protein
MSARAGCQRAHLRGRRPSVLERRLSTGPFERDGSCSLLELGLSDHITSGWMKCNLGCSKEGWGSFDGRRGSLRGG